MATAPERRALSGHALDAEIARIEGALVERQQRVATRATAIGRRARHAIAHPFGDGLIGRLGTAAFAWLLRPSRGAHQARRGESAPPSATGAWARWLAMSWPLLPDRLRARADPRVLAFATTLGVPLVEHLFALRRRRRGMALAESADRDRDARDAAAERAARDARSPSLPREAKPMRTLFLTAALTVLMLRTMSILGRTHRARLAAKPQAQPEPLQRWEGEGGNLPVVPKTVNPAIVPADHPA